MPRPDKSNVLYLSPSALDSIAGCEARWLRGRQERVHDAPGRPLVLGTILGEMQEEYHHSGDWRAAMDQALEAEGFGGGEWLPPDPWPTAQFLMERYEQWHPEHLALDMRATEVPFDQRLAPGVHMRGYLDGLADWAGDDRHDGGLYVVEFKSSGRWDRFYRLHLEPQSWIYSEAMRRQGSPVLGTIYVYTLTTHYKTEQPVDKSFRYKVVPYTEATAEHYRSIAREVADRALALEAGDLAPMRSIGQGCSWCPFRLPCLRPHELA